MNDEIDPLWEARRKEMRRGFLLELAGCALFLVVMWAVLGLYGALSGETDLCTESFKKVMKWLFN